MGYTVSVYLIVSIFLIGYGLVLMKRNKNIRKELEYLKQMEE